ncbi:hypothetical protein H9P43_002719 [Blastocladiella emersonii ATCC 22665]|nr:hypothetical protein H9P43_002719 [Blastocladiella emersonii ATCC 22665]
MHLQPDQLAAFMAIPRVRASFDRLRATYPDLHFTLTASGSMAIKCVADNSRPTTCPSCALSFNRTNDAARHFQTAHASDTLPDHFIDHLRRNAGSCALAFLCELAKDPPARDPNLMVTVAALLPAVAPTAPVAPGAALILVLVREIGFNTINSAFERLAPDAVPAGLPYPLSLDAFGVAPDMVEAADDAVDPLDTPSVPPRQASTRRRRGKQQQQKPQPAPSSRPRTRRRSEAARVLSTSPAPLSPPSPSPALASELVADGPQQQQEPVWDSWLLSPWCGDESADPWLPDPFGSAPPPPPPMVASPADILASPAASDPDSAPAMLPDSAGIVADVINWSRAADSSETSGVPLTVLDLVTRPSPPLAASPLAQSPMLQTLYIEETSLSKLLECAADAGIAVTLGPTLFRSALLALHESHPDLAFDVTSDGCLLLESRADGQRPMACPFPGCPQRFKRKRANDVARHFQTKHAPDALPFVCPVPCGSRTNRRDHFVKHLKHSESCVWRLLSQRGDPDVDIMMALAAQSGAFGAGHWTEVLAAEYEFDLADIPTFAPPPPPVPQPPAHGYAAAPNSVLQILGAANTPALEWAPPTPPLPLSPPPPELSNVPSQDGHGHGHRYAPILRDAGPVYPAEAETAAPPAVYYHYHHHHHHPSASDATTVAGHPAHVPSRYPGGVSVAVHRQQPLVSTATTAPAAMAPSWDPAIAGASTAVAPRATMNPAPLYSLNPAVHPAFDAPPATSSAAAGDSSAWNDGERSDNGGIGFLATLARFTELQQPQRAESRARAVNGIGGPHLPHTAAATASGPSSHARYVFLDVCSRGAGLG